MRPVISVDPANPGCCTLIQVDAVADVVVWAVDRASRPQDLSCVGNILDAMEAYAKGELGPQTIRLDEVDHLGAIGSDRIMAAVKEAHGRLRPYFKSGHAAIGSINSPMQFISNVLLAMDEP